MIQNQNEAKVSISELRARKPKIDSSDYSASESNSISTTILLEGDLIRLLRDYYKSGDFDSYQSWLDEIHNSIKRSLQLSFLELMAVDHVKSTTVVKFDRD